MNLYKKRIKRNMNNWKIWVKIILNLSSKDGLVSVKISILLFTKLGINKLKN